MWLKNYISTCLVIIRILYIYLDILKALHKFLHLFLKIKFYNIFTKYLDLNSRDDCTLHLCCIMFYQYPKSEMIYCHNNIIHIVEPECHNLKTNCEGHMTKIKLDLLETDSLCYCHMYYLMPFTVVGLFQKWTDVLEGNNQNINTAAGLRNSSSAKAG